MVSTYLKQNFKTDNICNTWQMFLFLKIVKRVHSNIYFIHYFFEFGIRICVVYNTTLKYYIIVIQINPPIHQ